MIDFLVKKKKKKKVQNRTARRYYLNLRCNISNSINAIYFVNFLFIIHAERKKNTAAVNSIIEAILCFFFYFTSKLTANFDVDIWQVSNSY